VLLGLVDAALARDRKNKCRHNKERAARERWATLSKREGEVANLVAKGHANREIADLLDISIKTVEIHRSRVMKKMEVGNVVGLIHEMALL
jgi:FixJ family two-component response regulator